MKDLKTFNKSKGHEMKRNLIFTMSFLVTLLSSNSAVTQDLDKEIVSALVMTHYLSPDQNRMLTRILANSGANVVDYTSPGLDHDRPPMLKISANHTNSTQSIQWPYQRQFNDPTLTIGADGFVRRNGLVNGWRYLYDTRSELRSKYQSYGQFSDSIINNYRPLFELRELELGDENLTVYEVPFAVSEQDFYSFSFAPTSIAAAILNQGYRTILNDAEKHPAKPTVEAIFVEDTKKVRFYCRCQ